MSSGMGAGGEDETIRVKRPAMYEKIDIQEMIEIIDGWTQR